MRRVAAYGLVLLVHGALLLLLLHGNRMNARQEPAIAFVSLWVAPRPPEPEPLRPVATPPPEPVPRSSQAPAQPAVAPAETSTTAPITAPESPSALIDWSREATAAAGRAGSRTEGPTTFSAAPKTQRKPCEPKESSFEWNPEVPRAGIKPLPYVFIGKRCVVALGFFACTFGKLPEANGKLFDDIEEGKTQDSSVPDPDHCD